MASFEVLPYSIDTLKRLLAETARTTRFVIESKTHTSYFESYFASLTAKTIVVENDYVDRDFLEDFAAYYVRCFQQYRHTCVRLHFFSHAFNSDDLLAVLEQPDAPNRAETLKSHYLGFIVVKALPQTILGRTCLKTYPPEGERAFPVTRRYDVSLFGIPLSVTTLAFQEQDQVAGMCATSAIWSAFHGTGILFHHTVPSPVDITKAASAGFPLKSRSLPNNGLTAEQMAQAIRSIGLEPLALGVESEEVLKSTIYAYLRCGIPVLMNVMLRDVGSNPPADIGAHAITVAGYRLGAAPNPPPSGRMQLRSSRITRLYAHDDQVGPFARLICDGSADGPLTAWVDSKGQRGHVRALPLLVLVPVYHKIRIPFSTIYKAVAHFDSLIRVLNQHAPPEAQRELEWDIYLTTVTQYKSELLASNVLTGERRSSLLTKSLPRFLWRSIAYSNGLPVLDLLFDATDIEQGHYFVHALEYDTLLGQIVRILANEPSIAARYEGQPAWKILEWFKGQSTPTGVAGATASPVSATLPTA